MTCKKCGGGMIRSKAIQQTSVAGVPDFPGAEIQTFSPGGPGKLIDCLKCEMCGWSVTDVRRAVMISSRILPCSTHTKVGDDMTWPSYDQGELEWQLRYGSEEQVIAARMTLASIVQGYRRLLELPQKRRNELCRAIREAR